MQNLKLIQKPDTKDEYDIKLMFLVELINLFTKKLNLRRGFYYRINKALKYEPRLRDLSYNENGLINLKDFQENYKKAKGVGGNVIYHIAPYFSSLSRLLALIYREVSKELGEEKTEKILKNCFEQVNKKYKESPDLSGYIPIEITGKAAAAYPISLMDSMINYLVKEVIEKGVKPEVIKKARPVRNIPEEVKRVYTEILGPLGIKQFEKIEDKLEINTIIEQIDFLRDKKILKEGEAGEFREKIKSIYGIEKLSKSKVQIAREVENSYIEMLGPLGIKQFEKIEKDLTKENILEQIEELRTEKLISEDRAEEFKNKINLIFE